MCFTGGLVYNMKFPCSPHPLATTNYGKAFRDFP